MSLIYKKVFVKFPKINSIIKNKTRKLMALKKNSNLNGHQSDFSEHEKII